MPAAKSGNNIYVTGSGNTLDSVTTDINDITFIEKVSNTPPTFELKGTVARTLYVRPGGELTIGDPNDFSYQEVLRFAPTANDRAQFNVDSLGTLKMYGNTKIICSTSATYYTSQSFRGKIIIQGNDTYRPVLEKVWRLYLAQVALSDADAAFNSKTWDKVNVENFWGTRNSGYLSFYTLHKVIPGTWSFTNMLIDGYTAGGDWNGYGITATLNAGEVDKVTLDNIEIRNCLYSVANFYNSGMFTNCHFHHNYYRAAQTTLNLAIQPRYYSDRFAQYLGDAGQGFLYFKDCVFDNNTQSSTTKYHIYMQAGYRMMFDGCTFDAVTYCGNISERALGFFRGTANTYSGNPNWSIYNGSTIFCVKDLDLTVVDKDGSPIENATITCEQNDKKEVLVFYTDNNGRPRTTYYLGGKILLTWREQLDVNGLSFSYWSDASNSTYHTITVNKDGYEPFETTLVMSEDRTITATLYKSSYGGKALNKLNRRVGLP